MANDRISGIVGKMENGPSARIGRRRPLTTLFDLQREAGAGFDHKICL